MPDQWTPHAFSVDSIVKDLNPSIDKPSWPLSSYGPSKYAATFIGGLDLSPEELRVRGAMAVVNGTLNDYVRDFIHCS
jgi:nucleoporin NUP42